MIAVSISMEFPNLSPQFPHPVIVSLKFVLIIREFIQREYINEYSLIERTLIT